MRTRWMKYSITFVLLCMTVIYPAVSGNSRAAASIEGTGNGSENQTVYLTKNSYATIQNVQFLGQADGKIFAFTVSTHNQDQVSLNLLDYWVEVRDALGKKYNVKAANPEASKATVAPGTTINNVYFTVVDRYTSLADLKIDLIKWDFSVSGYKRTLGTFQFSADTVIDAHPGESYSLTYENTDVNASIENYQVRAGQDETNLSIELRLENHGYRAVDISKIKYFVQTEDYKIYDATVSSFNNPNVHPDLYASIRMNATVPTAAAAKPLSLVMATDLGNNVFVPVGSFRLPESSMETPEGDVFVYDEFEVSVRTFQRVPGDADDILVAEISVTNKAKTARFLPELTGHFVMNGESFNENNTHTVVLDQILTIPAGQGYTFLIYTPVPYYTSLGEMEIAIYEEPGSAEPKVLHKFPLRQSTIAAREIAEPYVIDSKGQKAEVQIMKSGLYYGERANYFYTELAYHNLESRTAKMAEIAGIIQNEKRQVIPVNFVKYEERIFPDGKVLMAGWTKVPKNYSLEKARMMIGQKLNAISQDEGMAIAKPAYYDVDVATATKRDFKGITILNKFLSIRDFYPTLRNVGSPEQGIVIEGIELKFIYDLETDETYENPDVPIKLIMEFVDKDKNDEPYVKEAILSLNQEMDNATYLKDGMGISQTILFKDPDALTTLMHYQNYTINLYYEFQGMKLLLATKEFTWYTKGN